MERPKQYRPCYLYKGKELVSQFMSMAEAARKFGVNRNSIRYMIEKGVMIDGMMLSFDKIITEKKKSNVETKAQRAERLARSVKFASKEEKNMYKNALIEAMIWGENVK